MSKFPNDNESYPNIKMLIYITNVLLKMHGSLFCVNKFYVFALLRSSAWSLTICSTTSESANVVMSPNS